MSDLYIYEKIKVTRCFSCGFVQVSEGPDSDKIYSRPYFEHDKLSGRATLLEQKRRLSWVEACGAEPGMRLLDAGCATGEFLFQAEPIYDVHGIDISTYAIHRAQNVFPVLKSRLKAGALEDTDFGVDLFDVIVMWDVIEHLENPADIIEQFRKILKPGGLLCISTPNIGSLNARIMGKKWPFMTPPEHQVFFMAETLDDLMRQFDFKPVLKTNKGKWVNLRFALYKIQKIIQHTHGIRLLQKLIQFVPKNAVVYAPTMDILYAGYRLTKEA